MNSDVFYQRATEDIHCSVMHVTDDSYVIPNCRSQNSLVDVVIRIQETYCTTEGS